VVGAVQAAAKKRGIYVIDRGGDRGDFFSMFLDNKLRFIVRLVGDRNLLWRHRPILAETLASKCRMLYTEIIRRETDEGEKGYSIEYGVLPVKLPGRDEPLRLVVVRGLRRSRCCC